MKKYENFTKEELTEFCQSSESYRELASKIGYSPDGGSAVRAVKEMIELYQLDISHFKGQGHTKNLNKYRTPIEKYLNNEIQITSHKLRKRLLEQEIFEYTFQGGVNYVKNGPSVFCT